MHLFPCPVWPLPGMAPAENTTCWKMAPLGYYSSEGEAGRLAESMDDLFSLLVSCICWHDCCDAKQYVDSKSTGGIRAETAQL